MPVTLYVDELTPDKTFGITRNQAMLLENSNRIRIQNVEYHDDITALVFKAGRYVCVLAADQNEELVMMFFDLKKNEELAKSKAVLFEENLKELFMKNFYEALDNYERDYNLVELEVRNDFPSDFAAN